MKYRIAMSRFVGFLVACFCAVFAVAIFPFTSERIWDVWTLSLRDFNSECRYNALVGVIVETSRK